MIEILPGINRGRFLSPDQAARYLGGLNSRTVSRWAREGYMPAYPIGEGKRRLWRFLESDLEEWMRSRRTGSLSVGFGAEVCTSDSVNDAPDTGYVQ
jgi:excisionase family DNA binding protein